MPQEHNSADLAAISAIWRKDPAKLGPVLKPHAEKLGSLPLCAVCPFARWSVRKQGLHIYCKEFHAHFSAAGENIVTQCDSFALAQL